MKVAIVGASGQLGTDLSRAFAEAGHDVAAWTHDDIEISRIDSVDGALSAANPGLVVNTAAMHHLPGCEEKPLEAFAVNAVGARNLATACADRDVPLAHVSTDYVFDGAKGSPYLESDPPRPLNVYGNSKLSGEQFVRAIAEKHFIFRASALYGRNPCRAKGHNFVELMLRLGRERGAVEVVDDERVSPTLCEELAEQIVAVTAGDAYGLYHSTAEGCCSWYRFAEEIFRVADVRVELGIADPARFAGPVARPKYSVLENGRLNETGLNRFRPWQEGLRRYLGVAAAVVS